MTVKHTFQSAKAEGSDSSLVGPNEWNADHTITSLITGGVVAAGVTGTYNIDASLGNTWILSLTGNVTLTVSNPTQFQEIAIQIVQDSTGGRTVTWPASFIGGTNIDSSTPASQVIFQKFMYDGTNWRASSLALIS